MRGAAFPPRSMARRAADTEAWPDSLAPGCDSVGQAPCRSAHVLLGRILPLRIASREGATSRASA
jgi:hypothetical protein